MDITGLIDFDCIYKNSLNAKRRKDDVSLS